jgi:metal-responsive CopG/Arc/MetJ family transcriptional regulator
MAMSRCIIQVEPGMLARIDEMAAEKQRSRAWMIRELLLRQLSVTQPDQFVKRPQAASVVAVPPGALSCEFRPQSANPGRCESCGHGIGAHR